MFHLSSIKGVRFWCFVSNLFKMKIIAALVFFCFFFKHCFGHSNFKQNDLQTRSRRSANDCEENSQKQATEILKLYSILKDNNRSMSDLTQHINDLDTMLAELQNTTCIKKPVKMCPTPPLMKVCTATGELKCKFKQFLTRTLFDRKKN